MEFLWRDLRVAARRLRRAPGFTAVVVLTVALGVGLNTAVFSLVYSLLLRPFSFPDPERLYRIHTVDQRTGEVSESSAPDLVDWQHQTTAFEALGSFNAWNTQITGDGPAQSVYIAWVSPSFFRALGVAPLLGRTFLPEEDVPGGDVHKTIISHGLWQGRYGGDPEILGKRLTLRRTTYTIVGVMPPGFRFPDYTDLWAPEQSRYDADGSDRRMKYRGRRFLPVIARLAPGVTETQAREDLETVAAQLRRDFPKTNEDVGVRLQTLRESEVGPIRPYLVFLLGAVGFVLLIACANVASLMLSRAAGREREIGVQRTLGAGRRQLVQTLVTESLLLVGVLGGGLGLLLAELAVRTIPSLIPIRLPFWLDVRLDPTALGYGALLSLLIGVACGLYPALVLTGGDLGAAVKQGGRSGSAGGRRLGRARQALVVAEVALALLLLMGAGLMIRSFLNLRQVEPGFDRQRVVTAFVSPFRPPESPQAQIRSYTTYYQQVLEEIRRLPGVIAAGGSQRLPYLGEDGYSGPEAERARQLLSASGNGHETALEEAPAAIFVISPGYLEAMGIPIVTGRPFDERDSFDTTPVAIVSRRTAARLWPAGEALGQFVKLGDPGSRNPWREVVGIAGDVLTRADEGEGGLELYLPFTQEYAGYFHFVVRTAGAPETVTPMLRRTLEAVDPDTAVVHVKTLDRIVADSLWLERLWQVFFSLFAALAILLAAVGIYGVVSYTVNQRRREVGIRMALGADSQGARRWLLGLGMKMVGAGLVLGIAGALLLQNLISRLLFEVQATDPTVLLVVPLFLLSVALLACYVPAYRASKVDPITALHHD